MKAPLLILYFCSSLFSMAMAQGGSSSFKPVDAIGPSRDKEYTIHGEVLLLILVSIFAVFLLWVLLCVYHRRVQRGRKEEGEDENLGMGEKSRVNIGAVNYEMT
ncbi:hypothetical protein HPP92_023462 [Vanilla planifolia]|uniref:Uncharacterized protein n=1 Tax=Vanilla planifolia TaxID=51239 RepID=A0A835PTZ5_VANPL|nr:hypothetical protein HPP92_023752 [Vanilla planifolia]KAG0460334.1 hypothetical protein HPP92_023462 [Vanilla planifolia]